MIDRKYLKLNTSIQTGSNAQQLLTDEYGNLEARIELRLPDNLFASDKATQIEKVDMQTSKLRLSLEQTPIAQIPMDPDHAGPLIDVSTCQLDVYPFVIHEDGTFYPDPTDENFGTVFQNYKNHHVKYMINLMYVNPSTSTTDQLILDEYDVISNLPGYGFPEDSMYYETLKNAGVLDNANHSLRLTGIRDPEFMHVENGNYMVMSVNKIQQLLQDALENAVSYASTRQVVPVTVMFVQHDYPDWDQLDPVPDPDLFIEHPVYGKIYFQESYVENGDPDYNNYENSLKSACKPIVKLNQNSLTIGYDTACFDTTIPILANSAFVNTDEKPTAISLDSYRREALIKPIPKRAFRYGCDVNAETNEYGFTLESPMSCLPFNIIGNKATRDFLSFLPWREVSLRLPEFQQPKKKYTVDMYESKRTTQTVGSIYQCTRENNYTIYERLVQPGGSAGHYDGYDSSTSPKVIYIKVNVDRVFNTTTATEWGDNWSSGDRPVVNVRNGKSFVCQKETLSVTTTSSSTPIQHYETNETLTPGQTIISSSTTAETTYFNEDPSINSMCVYYKELNPETNEREYKIGTFIFAASTVNDLYVCVPPRDPDHITVIEEDEHVGEYYWEWDIPTLPLDEYYEDQYIGSTSTLPAGRIILTPKTSIQVEQYDAIVEDVTANYSGDEPPEDLRPKCYPNLELKDEPAFYMLDVDGTSVNIGEKEVIEVKENESEYMYNVEQDISYSDAEATTTTTIQRGSNEYPPSFLNVPKTTPGNRDAIARRYYGSDGIGIFVPTMDSVRGPNGIEYAIFEMDGVLTTESGTYGGASYEACLYGYNFSSPLETTFSGNRWNHDYAKAIFPISHDPVIESSTTTTEPEEITPPDSEQNSFDTNDPYTSGTVTETITQTVKISESIGDENGLMVFPNMIPERTYPDTTGIYQTMTYPARELHKNDIFTLNQKVIGGGWMQRQVRIMSDFKIPDWASNMPTTFAEHIFNVVPACFNTDCNIMQSITSGGKTGNLIRIYWIICPTELADYAGDLYQYQNFKTITSVYQNQEMTKTTDTTVTTYQSEYVGNVHLSFTWDNVPMVVMSPIQSFVLTLQGMDIQPEIQPLNINSLTNSSLTATVPVVENFYSLASTLSDLHDELVVAKESFEDNPTYTIAKKAGQERAVTICAKYITKDGALHQLFIPPTGVFALQLTFGISFYSSS